MKNGWGAASTWDTVAEAIEAARRSRPGRDVIICRSNGTWGGYRFGTARSRDIIGTVTAGGDFRGGKPAAAVAIHGLRST